MGTNGRNTIIDKVFKTLVFVANRRFTTANDLATELNVTRRHALRYLGALENSGLPVIISSLNHVRHYSLTIEWRKRHGFF